MSNLNEEFIDGLPNDPWEAVHEIYKKVPRKISTHAGYDAAIEAFLVAQRYCRVYLPETTHFEIELSVGNEQNMYGQIKSAFQKFNSERTQRNKTQTFEDMQARANALVEKVNSIEFTDGDLKRIQTLINQMRDIVTATEDVSERHRNRIMRRLEGLQQSLHKRMTRVDEFWLLLPAVGYSLGEFGNNAAPMWDKLNETLRIISRGEARQAQLPSDYVPDFLPNPELGDADKDDKD